MTKTSELEKKIYDPWRLLGKQRPSKHCKDKKEKIVMYDHVGFIMYQCDCGEYTKEDLILDKRHRSLEPYID